MEDKAKLKNTAKNCIIALLFVSSMFLLFRAVLYEPNSAFSKISTIFSDGSENNTTVLSNDESSELETKPVFLLVTTEDGSHYAVKYDSQSKETMLTKFSSILGEALGSSGDLRMISTDDWQKVLSGSGVFFDFLYPQPLSSIASSLGTEVIGGASDKTARRLFLGGVNGKLILYFINDNDGEIYSCITALDFSTLSPKIAEFPNGNANFAFEKGNEYSSLDPYFIFSNEIEKIRKISAANPLRSDFSATDLLNLFGMNSHSVDDYSEDDGSRVYVEGAKSLRIETSGKVIFSVTGNNGIPIDHGSDELTITDCISACSKIANNSIGLLRGNSELGLVKITNGSIPSSSGIFFGYSAGGLPIALSDNGYAANFLISGGTITKAELYFREYTFSGDTELALPEKQATAIAKSSGGEPVLVYEDGNDGVIFTWIRN